MPSERVSFRGGPQIDMALLLCVVFISTIGVLNLYSATSVYIGVKSAIAENYISQIYWIVVGTLFGILFAAIDYRFFERVAVFAYAGGVVLLGLVFVFALKRGAQRWIFIGTFQFQPSEFMKILVILVVAKLIHNDPKTEPRTLLDLVLPLGATLIPAALVAKQPDLGTAMIYMLTTLSMLGMTRIRRKSVAWLVAGLGASTYLVWKYALLPYQRNRILSFLEPEKHKTADAFQAIQSKIAIGNGGLTGEGFMQGTQNQFGYLPDQFSDFPFAVFAEERGFLGCVLLLGLYCFLCVWAVHIASQAKDRFGAAVAVGVGAMVFWHVIFNLGMVLGLLPVVGVTLPLFSYGGSSIVTTLIGLGLLMNVSMRR